LNIVHLSIFEIRHVKEINIYYQIERLIGDDEKIWINDYDDEADLFEGSEMKHIINLNIDVITMISKKEKDDEQRREKGELMEDEYKTYFLFESGNSNKKLDKLKSYK